MINPTGKKLEKLLFGIFDHSIEGIDRYNHNGSLWLIFTDEMRWVVEYTKSQTLWYNYQNITKLPFEGNLITFLTSLMISI